MKNFSIKKISVVFTVLFVVVFLTACGAGGFSQPLLPEAPFGTPDLIREVKTYRVEVFGQSFTNEAGNSITPILGIGEMVQTLQGEGIGRENRLTLHTDFYMQWEDLPLANENRNLRDEITGEVTFMRHGLNPIASNKQVNVAPRRNTYGFMFNNSYSFNSDFNARTSSVSFGKGENYAPNQWKNERNFNIPRGTVFCNEQLFILLRSFSNLIPGGSVSFPIHHPLENAIRGNNSNRTVVASSQITGRVNIDPFILDFIDLDFESGNGENEDESNAEANIAPLCADCGDENHIIEEGSLTIPVMVVNVAFGGSPSGPGHRIYMTTPNLRFSREGSNIETSRLIVRYEHLVFNADGSFAYRIRYTLIGYNSW